MGKHRRNRRNHSGERLDQLGERDRSGSAEQRRLRAVVGGEFGNPDRHDEGDGGGALNGNAIVIDPGGVRGERIGLRVYRSSQGEIRRSFEASEINAILNDPDVFPWEAVPGLESIDVSGLVADKRNFLLMFEGGGLLFACLEPGLYEVHNNWLKDYRGANAMKRTLEAIRWMFLNTDCMAIVARVSAHNKSAERMCSAVGAIKEFERKSVWPTQDDIVDMSFWALRYDVWIRVAKEFLESAREFHVKRDEEFVRHGREIPDRADEECLNIRTGALVEMIYAGQPEKAVWTYNSWALFAGYPAIKLAAKSPLVIDIGDSVLQFADRDFKVILCR